MSSPEPSSSQNREAGHAVRTRPAEPVRAVTFDAGGTLVESWPSVGHVYATVAAEHGHRHLAPSDLNRRFIQAWNRKLRFGYTEAEWADLVRQTFAGLIPAIAIDALFPALYERFSQAAAWRVFADVVPALTELRQRGLRTAVISNWDSRLRLLLQRLQLTAYFDTLVISSEAGAAKPDPRIFQAAHRILELPASSVLHVGDQVREDLEGAAAAGGRAVLLDRGGVGNNPGAIGGLGALRGLLG